MESIEETYRNAAVVQTTVDDPTNDREAGAVLITEGKCEDGVAYSVLSDDGFLDIECEVLDVFEADNPMSRSNIKQWGARVAKESDTDYSEV